MTQNDESITRTRRRERISRLAAALCASAFLFSAPASAGMIGTGELAAEAQAKQDRERIKAQAARPEVAKQLQALGVPPQDVQARVDALTEEEARSLAGRLNALPAGGFSDFEWVIIILLVVLVLVAV